MLVREPNHGSSGGGQIQLPLWRGSPRVRSTSHKYEMASGVVCRNGVRRVQNAGRTSSMARLSWTQQFRCRNGLQPTGPYRDERIGAVEDPDSFLSVFALRMGRLPFRDGICRQRAPDAVLSAA
jgi:hypothetical protein